MTWHVHECEGPDSFVLASATAHRILDVLKVAGQHLAAVDESNAHANLADVRHRPLTREVILAQRELDRLLHPESVRDEEGPVDTPEQDVDVSTAAGG